MRSLFKFIDILLILTSLFSTTTIYAKKVILAATLDFPPYEYRENNQEKGIAIDVIKEIVSRLADYDIKFYFYPWGRAKDRVKKGHNDILFNSGDYKSRRAWAHVIKTPIINEKYVFFVKKESSIRLDENLNDTHKLSIGIRDHFSYGTGVFKKSLLEKKYKSIQKVEKTEQLFQMLMSERIDLFIGNYSTIMHYLKENCLLSKVRVLKNNDQSDNLVILNWPTYILVSKKTKHLNLVEDFSKTLRNVKNDGTYKKIEDSYQEFSKNRPDCK